MESTTLPPEIFKLAGHPIRWNLLTRLARSDERTVYYSLDFEQFQTQFLEAGKEFHPALINGLSEDERRSDRLTPKLRVLLLCTHNSARSQMAEVLLRHLSHGEILAYSARSSPASRVHPLAIAAMEAIGINMHEQYPKHFERYREQHFDTIVTVSWTRTDQEIYLAGPFLSVIAGAFVLC